VLKEFYEEQSQFCLEIEKSILKNKKISHAYLIESKQYPKTKELVGNLAQLILNTKENKELSLENNPDFKWIEPEGAWIKKEQLKELQESFKTKSLIDGYRVYVIYQAEKLNKSSSNAILKFLEEPAEKIVAILVANNRYQVLPTITSRCQIFSLEEDKGQPLIETEELSNLVSFIILLEKEKKYSIAFITPYYKNIFFTKETAMDTMNSMFKLYTAFFEYKTTNKNLPFLKYKTEFENILTNQEIYDIISKLKVISRFREELNYNVNLKIWLDSFVIAFGGE